MKSVEDYRQGFLDGMSANQNYPHTLMIMGKTFDEILALICKDEEEKFRNRPRLIIDHIDKMPVIIKRNGKIIYEE